MKARHAHMALFRQCLDGKIFPEIAFDPSIGFVNFPGMTDADDALQKLPPASRKEGVK